MKNYTMRWSLGRLDLDDRTVTFTVKAENEERAIDIGSVRSYGMFCEMFGPKDLRTSKVRHLQSIFEPKA